MKTNFKQYLAIFSILGLFGLFACTGTSDKKAEGEANADTTAVDTPPQAELVDPRGEKEANPTTLGKLEENDDSFVKFTANGQEFECKYVAGIVLKANHFERYDKDRCLLNIERGSNDQMTEKIIMTIINYDLDKIKYPLTIKPEKIEGKHIAFVFSSKKAGIFIDYHNQNAVSLTFEKYNGEYLEGTFSCVVENAASKTIKIENGTFKIKVVMVKQQPA